MQRRAVGHEAPMSIERRLAEVEKHLRTTNAALARVIRRESAACGDDANLVWQGEARLVKANRKLLRALGGRRRPLAERQYPPLLAIMEGISAS